MKDDYSHFFVCVSSIFASMVKRSTGKSLRRLPTESAYFGCLGMLRNGRDQLNVTRSKPDLCCSVGGSKDDGKCHACHAANLIRNCIFIRFKRSNGCEQCLENNHRSPAVISPVANALFACTIANYRLLPQLPRERSGTVFWKKS